MRPLPAETKVDLAQALADQIDAADGRLPEIGPAFDSRRPASGRRGAPSRSSRWTIEDQLERAATSAFSWPFLAAAALAALALIPIAQPRTGSRREAPDGRAQQSPAGRPRGLDRPDRRLRGLRRRRATSPPRTADPCETRDAVRARGPGRLRGHRALGARRRRMRAWTSAARSSRWRSPTRRPPQEFADSSRHRLRRRSTTRSGPGLERAVDDAAAAGRIDGARGERSSARSRATRRSGRRSAACRRSPTTTPSRG